MKLLKYLFAILFALAAISCSEEPILQSEGDEDEEPIIIGGGGGATAPPADSVQVNP